LPDASTYLWFFFKFSGRVGRAAYILGFLFTLMLVSLPLNQFIRVPEGSPSAQGWSLVFGLTFLAFLWAHIALSVKRLHDLGRPGILSLALFIPVVSIVAFVLLCAMPGNPGPNGYGQFSDTPK
jgi:uncharacterized membrane protein YhaH (DUF805 family)